VALAVKHKDYGAGIPQHEIEIIARCLFPKIQKFYETEEGKKVFEEWKKKHNKDTEIERV